MNTNITLRHPASKLDGKSIRFRVKTRRGEPPEQCIASGTGVLHISHGEEADKFTAVIAVDEWPESGVGTATFYHIPLDQKYADCIQILSEPKDGVELECLPILQKT